MFALQTLLTLAFILFPLATASPAQRFVKGLDTGDLVALSDLKSAYKEGFVHVVFRGYQEVGKGRVDPNFLTNYRNAKTAKMSVDAFWFPCSGKERNCKPYEQQVIELLDYIKVHDMDINRVWLDYELSGTDNYNYGRTNGGNLAQAKEMAAALEKHYPRFGIYCSPGEWFNMFGSFGAVVNNKVPLWWASWDDKSSYEEMKHVFPAFGGWTDENLIVGKQYTNESSLHYLRDFDLNVFLNP